MDLVVVRTVDVEVVGTMVLIVVVVLVVVGVGFVDTVDV